MPGNDQGVGARARGQERKGKDVSAASSYPALIELLPPFYRVRNKHRPVRNSGKSNIPSRARPLPNRKFSPDNHLEKVNDFPSNILRKTGPKMYVQSLVRSKERNSRNRTFPRARPLSNRTISLRTSFSSSSSSSSEKPVQKYVYVQSFARSKKENRTFPRAHPLPNRKFSLDRSDNHLEKVDDFPSNILLFLFFRETSPKM